MNNDIHITDRPEPTPERPPDLATVLKEYAYRLKGIERQLDEQQKAMQQHANDVRWATEAAIGKEIHQLGEIEKHLIGQLKQVSGAVQGLRTKLEQETTKTAASNGGNVGIIFLLLVVIGMLIYIAVKVH